MRNLISTILLVCSIMAGCAEAEPLPYMDCSHQSKVFQGEKEFRIYLPKDYNTSDKHYPVIYFLHGWGGRHFKDDNAKFDYVKIDSLVQVNKVILVMLDGNIEESEPRPYNIGGHADVKYQLQFKDYFLEIMSHIDSTYRTINDRDNRSLIGYSMGGFMSFYLAGKYPHMVCAAADLTGSPEFFVGYPDNHTLYSHRHTFGNLHGVRLRLHNSTVGELAWLNREVYKGALREKGIQIEYQEFEGGHKVDLPGEVKVLAQAFDFVCTAMRSPEEPPQKWNHLDLYPDFDVWDYKVSSNKETTGFIELKGVTKNGFSLSTKKWLPDGPVIPDIEINLQTAPVYPPNSSIMISETKVEKGTTKSYALISDTEGRLHFNTTGDKTIYGIRNADELPELVFMNYRVNGTQRFLKSAKPNLLEIQIFNRGFVAAKNLSLDISSNTFDAGLQEVIHLKQSIEPGESLWVKLPKMILLNVNPPFETLPNSLRMNLSFKSDQGLFAEDAFELPLFYDLDELTDIAIDDGRALTGSIPVLGKGNGNGLAEAGETIVIYSAKRPLRLYYDTPYIKKQNEVIVDKMLPARWPDGFTLYSMIKIEDVAPSGTNILLQANYESKEFMPIKRMQHWGNILLHIN